VKTGNEWGTFIRSSPSRGQASRAHKVGVAIQKLRFSTDFPTPMGGAMLLKNSIPSS